MPRRCRIRGSGASSAPVLRPPISSATSNPGRRTISRDKAGGSASPPAKESRLRALSEEYRALAAKLREGGGAARVAKMHQQGKLAPRERVERLLDPGAPWLEIGLLVAYDQYDGQAPGAGVITGIGVVEGREVVVVANDATVKAGSWWPDTNRHNVRQQEIAT